MFTQIELQDDILLSPKEFPPLPSSLTTGSTTTPSTVDDNSLDHENTRAAAARPVPRNIKLQRQLRIKYQLFKKLNEKYADRVLPKHGYCLHAEKITAIHNGNNLIPVSDGGKHFNGGVIFRVCFTLIIFRPEIGDVLEGKVIESTVSGLKIGVMGVNFHSVFLPRRDLQDVSVFCETEKLEVLKATASAGTTSNQYGGEGDDRDEMEVEDGAQDENLHPSTELALVAVDTATAEQGGTNKPYSPGLSNGQDSDEALPKPTHRLKSVITNSTARIIESVNKNLVGGGNLDKNRGNHNKKMRKNRMRRRRGSGGAAEVDENEDGMMTTAAAAADQAVVSEEKAEFEGLKSVLAKLPERASADSNVDHAFDHGADDDDDFSPGGPAGGKSNPLNNTAGKWFWDSQQITNRGKLFAEAVTASDGGLMPDSLLEYRVNGRIRFHVKDVQFASLEQMQKQDCKCSPMNIFGACYGTGLGMVDWWSEEDGGEDEDDEEFLPNEDAMLHGEDVDGNLNHGEEDEEDHGGGAMLDDDVGQEDDMNDEEEPFGE
ncbi:unnamed protein product [Amoebophrya sp. A120]|nr:unnamed protein product [Amoebophrya sp. A120]|eukprot:GSA120T00025479001.1